MTITYYYGECQDALTLYAFLIRLCNHLDFCKYHRPQGVVGQYCQFAIEFQLHVVLKKKEFGVKTVNTPIYLKWPWPLGS